MINGGHILYEIISEAFLGCQHQQSNQKSDGEVHSTDQMQYGQLGGDALFLSVQDTKYDRRRYQHLQNITVDRIVLEHGKAKYLQVMNQSDELQDNEDDVDGDRYFQDTLSFIDLFIHKYVFLHIIFKTMMQKLSFDKNYDCLKQS